ncbi:hypothetical protein [Mycoplasmoides pirum]|uniref:hypothetical protein n=1 Tax=Mycoplasmoides pirum TaxID=2122 RepID=UPI00048906A4|nr:hypothetical protein [Mycoplasmoides pirum]
MNNNSNFEEKFWKDLSNNTENKTNYNLKSKTINVLNEFDDSHDIKENAKLLFSSFNENESTNFNFDNELNFFENKKNFEKIQNEIDVINKKEKKEFSNHKTHFEFNNLDQNDKNSFTLDLNKTNDDFLVNNKTNNFSNSIEHNILSKDVEYANSKNINIDSKTKEHLLPINMTEIVNNINQLNENDFSNNLNSYASEKKLTTNSIINPPLIKPKQFDSSQNSKEFLANNISSINLQTNNKKDDKKKNLFDLKYIFFIIAWLSILSLLIAILIVK